MSIPTNKTVSLNPQFLSLTYGAIVAQLVNDLESTQKVNEVLKSFGYNVGIRLIDEFLAKSEKPPATNFKALITAFCGAGFAMFFGEAATLEDCSGEDNCFYASISNGKNPLIEFVMLPPELDDLDFNIFYCGLIIGAMEMIGYSCDVEVIEDPLHGADKTVLKISLKEFIQEVYSNIQ